MDGVTRRDFLKGTLGVGACIAMGMSGRKSVLNGDYDVEWDEAIRENENRDWGLAIRENCLREQIGYLMNETDTGIVYTHRREDRERVTSVFCDRGFFGKDVPVRHLRVIRQKLLDNFVCRNNGNSYNYATIYVRDRGMSAVGWDYYSNIFS